MKEVINSCLFEPYQLTVAASACAKLYMNKFLELNNTPTSKQKNPSYPLSQLQVETVCSSSTFIMSVMLGMRVTEKEYSNALKLKSTCNKQ